MAAVTLDDLRLLLDHGKVDAAFPHLARMVVDMPAYLPAWALLARAFEQRAQWPEAQKIWAQMAFMAPEAPVVRDGLRETRRMMRSAGSPAAPAPRVVPEVAPPVAPAPRIAPEVTPPVSPAPRIVPEVAPPVAPAPRIAPEVTPPVSPAPRVAPEVIPPVSPAPRVAPEVIPPVSPAPRIAPEPPVARPDVPEPAPRPVPPVGEPRSFASLFGGGLRAATPLEDGPPAERAPLPIPPIGSAPARRPAPEAPDDAFQTPRAWNRPAPVTAVPPADLRPPPAAPPEVNKPNHGLLDLDNLDDLIDALTTKPRIEPRSDLDAIPPPDLESNVDNVASETLARILAMQKQYAQAADMYARLARQHPDRASHFNAEAEKLRALAS